MLKRPSDPKLRVTGICPETGATVPTHALLSSKELARFDRTLALFCPACRRAHVFDRKHLRLDCQPPGQV